MHDVYDMLCLAGVYIFIIKYAHIAYANVGHKKLSWLDRFGCSINGNTDLPWCEDDWTVLPQSWCAVLELLYGMGGIFSSYFSTSNPNSVNHRTLEQWTVNTHLLLVHILYMTSAFGSGCFNLTKSPLKKFKFLLYKYKYTNLLNNKMETLTNYLKTKFVYFILS